MSYAAAVDHLYARGLELAPDPSLPPGKPRKFDLEHMRILARALGDPQEHFPSVLIAGTNGKGSTSATLASILSTAGYRTALYTSPHLSRVNERIQIDGQPISDDDFARLYFRVDTVGERLVASGQLPQPPSYFEVVTAIAFLYFAGSPDSSAPGIAAASTSPAANTSSPAPVDIAILEVGLGGRLDATNIVSPVFSILTDIALDHQEFLGHTIAEITREKAGILRPRGTLITLPQHPEANQTIGEVAATLDLHAVSAANYIPTSDKLLQPTPSSQSRHSERSEESLYSVRTTSESLSARTAPSSGITHKSVILSEAQSAESKDLRSNPAPFHNRYDVSVGGQPLHVDSPLWGQHQQRNIAIAIAAAEELRNPTGYRREIRNSKSYKITNAQIEAGIRNTYWPARLELLPLSNSAPVLLDVAHNPAGAWALRAALGQLPDSRPRTLLFSCLRDKDLREMSQILLPLFDSSSFDRPHDHILFAPINNPRAASLDELTAAAQALEIPAETTPTLAEALDRARALTPQDGIIVATGSLYLIGELRTLILSTP